MSDTLRESIARQRASLTALLAEPMGGLAARCAAVWGDRQALNEVLSDGIVDLPHCKFLYAVGPDCIQLSDNVTQKGLITTDFGRDRSHRPYMQELPAEFVLSEAYISVRANRPSLTAVEAVRRGGELLGYLGADFDMRDLPLTRELYEEPKQWRQVRGDPAIRGTVFLQTRVESMLDRFIDSALAVLDELITEHGVFHTTIHFSSSRATIWLLDDPYRYRLLDMDALNDPDMCLAYPRRDYPDQAVIPADRVRPILERFRQLRFSDENIYLRAGSINVFNGMVSLTFSCDGSHYLPYEEFLHADMDFWGLGVA
jgi:hypothetical protein